MDKSSAYMPVDQTDMDLRTSVDDEQVGFLSHVPQTRKKSRRCRFLWYPIFFLVFIAYSAILVSWTLCAANYNRRYGTRFSGPESPAEDFIKYEYRQMEQWERGLGEGPGLQFFTSPPNGEVDKNWHDLLEYQNIGLSANIMEHLGREDEGIELPDGTYYGSFMVFHHLHCLKMIYRALNPEYYGLHHQTDKQQEAHKDHTSHCLHLLREAVMCQGDTTIITMMFADYSLRPIGNFTSQHECVDWSRLMEWVEPNSRDLTQEGWLVHPSFGPVVIDGHLGNGPI